MIESLALSLRNHDWREVIKILVNDFGFRVDRQRGDHIMLLHDQTRRYATVPRHRPIKETTMRTILYQAGITIEDFLRHV
jgi:predicted RNA binding protein YcfA (HicA-like mRNA interferase family)